MTRMQKWMAGSAMVGAAGTVALVWLLWQVLAHPSVLAPLFASGF